MHGHRTREKKGYTTMRTFAMFRQILKTDMIVELISSVFLLSFLPGSRHDSGAVSVLN